MTPTLVIMKLKSAITLRGAIPVFAKKAIQMKVAFALVSFCEYE